MVALFNEQLLDIRSEKMPPQSKKQPQKFTFKGFINLDFNDAERIEINTWLENQSLDVVDSIVAMIEDGAKLGYSYDESKNVYTISYTVKSANSPYRGKVFILKHSDVGKGTLIMRYVLDTRIDQGHYDFADESSKYDW